MRLFHVSESPDIGVFHPRPPERAVLEQSPPLVWAIDEARLANYLLPRDCPRVTFHAAAHTSESDIERFLGAGASHCVAIEHCWFEAVRGAILYVYEFDPAAFRLLDECAGYYVSERAETPARVTKIDDVFAALFERRAEVRLVESLWWLADAVQASTLNWSLIRMRNARPR